MTETPVPPWPFPSIAQDNEPPAGAVSFMITMRQRVALRALGLSEEAIELLTPAEAHALLRDRPQSPKV